MKIDKVGAAPYNLGDETVPHGCGVVESFGFGGVRVLEETIFTDAREAFSGGADGVVGGPLFVAFAAVWCGEIGFGWRKEFVSYQYIYNMV